MKAHVVEWHKIWQPRIDLGGNCDMAAIIHASFYYILNSMPMSPTYEDDGWPFFGISPDSLPGNDFNVKIFFLKNFVELCRAHLLGPRCLDAIRSPAFLPRNNKAHTNGHKSPTNRSFERKRENIRKSGCANRFSSSLYRD